MSNSLKTLNKQVFFLWFFLSLLFCSNISAQIQLLNDEFEDGSSLSDWSNINDTEQWNAEHLEVHDINNTTEGHLHLMPHTGVWYANYRSNLLYKTVDEDFIFTTEVTSTNRTEDGIPTGQYSLAGMMIRTPRDYPNGATQAGGWTSGGENYIFFSVGRATSSNPQFEVKSTINSNSNLEVTTASSNENVQLRMARIGDAILVLYRMAGEDWTIHRRFERSDFPAEIQIGFVAYTDWGKSSTYDPYFHNSNVLDENLSPDPNAGSSTPFAPGLIGTFDFARFDLVELPAFLAGVDLVNTASDEDLLTFLDFESVPYACFTGSTFTGPELSLTLFLEAAIDPSSGVSLMRTELRNQNLLPLSQPYDIAPWNYSGTESVASIGDFPSNAVDWVLVELRSGTPNLSGAPGTTLLERLAGILLDDGSVVSPDGSSELIFNQMMPGEDYHVLVRHRNHLDVISSGTVRQGENMSYDFSQCEDAAFGTQQLKLENTVYAMFAGDFNADAVIQTTDYNQWQLNPAILNSYEMTDCNLDGTVQVADYDDWYPNRAKTSPAEVSLP